MISAVADSATEPVPSRLLLRAAGFRFPALEAETQHAEAEAGVRLMIDAASLMEGLVGEPPRPGDTSGFAVECDSPAEVDEAAARGGAAGHTVVTAPWGQGYATVADPDAYRADPFCPHPG
jgi:uncharacterized glyoxalase superfamily protein PhnB